MKLRTEVPELDVIIQEHAQAIAAGRREAAENFVSPAALEAHREFIASATRGGSLKGFEALGRAKIGFQHMSKVRFIRDGEPCLMLNRWRNEGGTWRIASVEDLSGKRSPWSDIETPAALRTGER